MTTACSMLICAVSLSLITTSNAYFLGLHALEWPNASTWCQSYCGSHLASVHTVQQHTEMLRLVDNMYPYVYSRTWIGLNDIKQTDVWVWSDGTPFDLGNVIDTSTPQNYVLKGNFPWRSNEPDYNKSDDQCVAIEVGSLYSTQSRRWVDRRQTANYQFFCNSCSGKLHKYAVINGDRNASDADTICKELYGTGLASIHSDSDMVEARLTCKQISQSNGCWLGLSDIAVPGSYVWKDGTTWDYGTITNQYPWYVSEPGGASGQNCIFLDPENGADPGEYLWDDYWCDRVSPKALCNAPSEICKDQEWFIPTGNPNDWVFTKRPCELTKTVLEPESVAMLANKQWLNTDGVVIVDMQYTVNTVGRHGNAGLAFYFDELNCDNWFYVGIWIDVSTIFIGKSVNGNWNLLNYTRLNSVFNKGTFYSLIVEITSGSRFSVKFNNVPMISAQDTTNAGNTKSGYVGIRNVNATFTVKSLFVSGEVEYGDNVNQWYLQCTASPTTSPTNPTSQPTKSPTLFPTLSPSVNPTIAPSQNPSLSPTDSTSAPTPDTPSPTTGPSVPPTQSPSSDPTISPTNHPTLEPTVDPTSDPTTDPTYKPSLSPTDTTISPTSAPSATPTIDPTPDPTEKPTVDPTTSQPSTSQPSSQPTSNPTAIAESAGPEVGTGSNPGNAGSGGEQQAAVQPVQQSYTRLIWIVGIPIGLILTCIFGYYLFTIWKEEHEDKDDTKAAAVARERRKSSHIRSPSVSKEEDGDDDETASLTANVENREIELEVADDTNVVPNDEEQQVFDTAMATTHAPVNSADDGGVPPTEQYDNDVIGDEAKVDKVEEEEKAEELEEVVMIPNEDGKMVVNPEGTADSLESEEANEQTALKKAE